jgi:transposase-like protein
MACRRLFLAASLVPPLSYPNLEDMMRERGLHIDHTTIYRSRAMLRT